MRRRLTAVTILVMLAWLPLAGWAVNASDLDWINGLPSVTPITTTNQNGKVVRTYTVASGRSFYTALERGLEKRGWTISSRPQVSTGDGFIGGYVATRKGQVLHLTTAGGILTASLEAGGVGGNPATGGGSVAVESGSLTINDSHTHKTMTLDGALTLNASHCKLTINGHCRDLTVNGSHNEVVFNGRIDAVTLNGPYNKVRWSRAGNGGRSPVVSDNGVHNATSGF